ncbi:hypothetical protein CWB73_02180 [Pseudoalteromonas phenolica]|uniref:Uncharacterized protein n=2 Tax=Pseudoalteromonas phenolica TaxID=161398 RepID=A0A5S3YYB6_9GAMM|nr:hypothetical protein CWB73_02180 [Pseudoalteromonas phenolica]
MASVFNQLSSQTMSKKKQPKFKLSAFTKHFTILGLVSSPWVNAADIANYQNRSVTPPKISSSPNIDGEITQAEWQNALVIDDFVEYRPEVGQAPDHPIKALVAYDEDYFYVAAHITQPADTITDRLLTQGSFAWREDYFGLVLDTNFDKSDAYLFHVTPSGVKIDGLVDGSNYIEEWNTIWYAKTKKTDKGWDIEIAIPMQSISFDENKSSWGLQLRYKSSKPYQQYYWNLNNTQDSPWNANQVGEIKNISGLKQGKGIEVRTGLSANKINDESNFEPSIDVGYKFTPNLTGLLTLNTDFSGTEIDAQDVNMTRFNSYFNEQRDFFLQDAQLFQFGQFAPFATNGMPFYSRRIGLSPESEVLDINWGTKLTGQIDQTQLGVLSVNQDSATQSQNNKSTQLSVARLKELIDKNHSLGGVYTQGAPTGDDDSTIGIDYSYNDVILEDQSIRFNTWYNDVDNEHATGSDSASYGLQLELPNDTFYWRTRYQHIGEDYNPSMGFVSRKSIEYSEHVTHYRVRPNEGVLADNLNFFMFVAGRFSTHDLNGNLLSERLTFQPLSIQNKNSDSIRLAYNRKTENLTADWAFSDSITYKAGEHKFDSWQLVASSGTQRPIYATLTVNYGEHFSADLVDYYANLYYQPNKHIFLNVGRGSYYYEQQHNKYAVHRSHIRLNVALNADWSWNTLLQHNTRSDKFSLFSRIKYQSAPDAIYQISLAKGYDISEGWSERTETFEETSLKINYIHRW